MKKISLLIIIFIFPIFIFSANLIQNPGFETWTGTDSIPDNWFVESSTSVPASKDSSRVNSGNYSVKLNRLTSSNSGIKHFVTTGISSGDTFTFYIYISDNDVNIKVGGFLRTYQYGGSYETELLSYTSDNANWQTLNDTFVTLNGACSLGVFIRAYKDVNDSGVVYLDDAFLDIKASGGDLPPYLYDEGKTPDYITPEDTATLFISAYDEGTINYDTMYYKINSGSFSTQTYDSISGSTYYYHINAQTQRDTVYYFYAFRDNNSNRTISDTLNYILYATDIPDVFINEIMYNPSTTQGNDADFEWIELWNIESDTIDMQNWTLSDGEATFTFPDFQLPPNHFAVICSDTDSIRSFYGTKSLGDGDDYLLGNMALALNSDGDQVVLKKSSGALVDSVNYDDVTPWPTAPDGTGPSLELKDPLNFASHNQGAGWAASTGPGADYGTPGDINSTYNPSGIINNIKRRLYKSEIHIINNTAYIKSGYNTSKSVSIYNLYGASIYKRMFSTENISFKLPYLTKGIYFLNVKSHLENSSKKFILIK